jgi:type IV secretion system protein VirB6
MTSMAMQQGGLGLILTALIVSTPPIAAILFQGTLGSFSPYNAFQSQPTPGSPGNPGGTLSRAPIDNSTPVPAAPNTYGNRM